MLKSGTSRIEDISVAITFKMKLYLINQKELGSSEGAGCDDLVHDVAIVDALKWKTSEVGKFKGDWIIRATGPQVE